MTNANLINSIGLICDIVGAVLLWLYGLPEPIDPGGKTHIVLEQIDENEKTKARLYDIIARWGVALLVTGFSLQLVSNFL